MFSVDSVDIEIDMINDKNGDTVKAKESAAISFRLSLKVWLDHATDVHSSDAGNPQGQTNAKTLRSRHLNQA